MAERVLGSGEEVRDCFVLRVKRRREEDPTEALVVSKYAKIDTTTVAKRSVFNFLGTLVKEEACDGVILDKLKHYKDRSDQLKPNPFAKLSLEDTKKDARELLRERSSAQRFLVTSKLRCLQPDVESSRQSHSGMKSPLADERIHMCDVISERESEYYGSMEANGEQSSDVVTCNGAVMVREKVVPKSEGSDYVYDLYYAREPRMIDMETATFDWNSLSAYQPEFVHDIIGDEVYDDEDDSNDEDNWRNDYPDEESSHSYSDSAEEGDREHYRHWEPDYDEYRPDSDDDL